MKNFNRINNITGWAVFAIATLVYLITVEETASFWDCGEFIAVSYRLMVPHPPGAPFYLLMGRLFSMFAPGPESVGYFINLLSVLSSSFTILFLFWSIVLFGRKTIKKSERNEDGSFTTGQTIALMGAGVVGALAYTFSDSFWFSAVEAEVYAFSSFFTAFVIWAMLKWDLIEDEQRANRWLLLIAYMMGLSIGVHLLNLTTIPALALLYYFKKRPKAELSGAIISLVIGVVIVGVVMVGIIPGLPSMAGKFEVFFVNSLGLPFNSGMIFFVGIVLAALVYGIHYSYVNRKEHLNTSLLALSFILIGYSTYALVLIRSQANPPIDENNPENLISFVSYLKREQYGDRPLVYGRTFDAELDRAAMQRQTDAARKKGKKPGTPQYRKKADGSGYEIYDYRTDRIYKKNKQMLLPRVYSQQPGHADLYRSWMDLKPNQSPSFGDNLGYMFRYQFGHMYFRYFMWNFAGRDGDEKEAGWLLPWETNSDEVPEEIKKNKSRSNFYMIPFILGLLGMFFQLSADNKNFWVNMFLFFLMGLGLVLYLNSPPVEPRERDYIYVGSFYAFCIWIGFSVLGIYNMLKSLGSKGAIAATLICATAPALMGINGWDNHNRSNRFHSIDQARNTLESCAPNAILFTGGDNDTFPLWYVQEVEGFRTDVRVVVMSYFSTDWYIHQMRRQVHESEPLPFTISQNMYRQGKNDYVPLVGESKQAVRLKSYINAIQKDDPQVQVPLMDGSVTAKLLSNTFVLDIDTAKLKDMDFITEEEKSKLSPQMVFTLKQGKTSIFKNDLAILDLLATNNWERPIYFNNTSANTSNLELRNYLRVEGMAFRVMPFITKTSNQDQDVGEVNAEIMAANLEKFQFRGFDDPSTFNDEEYRKFGANTRNTFYRLALKQFNNGDKEAALKTMNTALEKIPDTTIPYSYFIPRYVDLYYKLGETETAKELSNVIGERALENMEYVRMMQTNNFKRLSKSRNTYNYLRQKSLMVINQLMYVYRRQEAAADREINRLNALKGLGEEEDLDTKISEAQSLKEFYANESKKYTEAFGKFADLR
ncbi:MAG: DUF2723 domain-containing protein [Flammeovirgaceae bacterium]